MENAPDYTNLREAFSRQKQDALAEYRITQKQASSLLHFKKHRSGIHRSTIKALVRRGLIHKDQFSLTREGHVLCETLSESYAHFLHRHIYGEAND